MNFGRALRTGLPNNNGIKITASIKSLSFTKEYDFTFSLERPTTRSEVISILRGKGCIEKDKNPLDYISMIAINENNNENGQVTVTCVKPGLANEMVRKLEESNDPRLKRLHSYANDEVPVKFHFIHPTVNIQRDIVEGLLEIDGRRVKEWHAQRDNQFKVLTGGYTFIMYGKELAKHPLPYTVFINGHPTTVYYRTRPKICFTCYGEGHLSKDCSQKKPPKCCYTCGKEDHLAKDCPNTKKQFCDSCNKEGHLSENCLEMPPLEETESIRNKGTPRPMAPFAPGMAHFKIGPDNTGDVGKKTPRAASGNGVEHTDDTAEAEKKIPPASENKEGNNMEVEDDSRSGKPKRPRESDDEEVDGKGKKMNKPNPTPGGISLPPCTVPTQEVDEIIQKKGLEWSDVDMDDKMLVTLNYGGSEDKHSLSGSDYVDAEESDKQSLSGSDDDS